MNVSELARVWFIAAYDLQTNKNGKLSSCLANINRRAFSLNKKYLIGRKEIIWATKTHII